MSGVVRAVDVGFGNTKYVVSSKSPRDIECALFPSLAPLASTFDLSGGVIGKRDSVIISVGDDRYEVGPDAALVLGTHAARVLNKDFCEGPEYLALLRGALSYISAPQIDLLVVGLPVSLLNSKGARLKQILETRHRLCNDEEANVSKVLVLAQPLGGLINYSLTQGIYDRIRQQRNLVIDVGFFTVDWIVARGIQPAPRRCGSFAGGIHAVLRRLAHVISEDRDIDFDDLTNLDEGLQKGVFNVSGRPIDLEHYLPAAKSVIQEAVNALVNSVGDGRDIDNIVLVGGGGQIFHDAIAARFPSHLVRIVSDPVFSNVRGFQLAGEELLRRSQAEVT